MAALQACSRPPETFISCLDFQLPGAHPPSPAPIPPMPKGPCGKVYAQCGGHGWKGATCCVSGTTCEGTDWFKECKPAKATAAVALAGAASAAEDSATPVRANRGVEQAAAGGTPLGDPLGSCHTAAEAFCNGGHGNCLRCQAWGTWGNMFFAAVCNDSPTTCHQNITAADGTLCTCQRKGGCTTGGATCPYGGGPSPPSPSPTPGPSPGPPIPPTPKGPCGKAYAQCGGHGWKGATCCVSGSTCEGTDWFKECKPAKATASGTDERGQDGPGRLL